MTGVKLLSTVFLLIFIERTTGYHEHFDNTQFHCWLNDDADKYNDFRCEHVNFVWLVKPPVQTVEGRPFSVKYELQFEDGERPEFFRWLIRNNWLRQATTVEEAEEFCNKECGDPWEAHEDNCCVHHINIHSCPQYALEAEDDMCGPWISPRGDVFTHTPTMATNITTWDTDVVLHALGLTELITHIRIGAIQMSLGAKTWVHPKANCGDGECYATLDIETCESCPDDCCPLPDTRASIYSLDIESGQLHTADEGLVLFHYENITDGTEILGTVCVDYFNYYAANLMCQFLGYDHVDSWGSHENYKYITEDYIRENNMPILLDDIKCGEEHANLADCGVKTVNHNCGHHQDLWMKCSNKEGKIKCRDKEPCCLYSKNQGSVTKRVRVGRSFNDGCNSCRCMEGGIAACTLMACPNKCYHQNWDMAWGWSRKGTVQVYNEEGDGNGFGCPMECKCKRNKRRGETVLDCSKGTCIYD